MSTATRTLRLPCGTEMRLYILNTRRDWDDSGPAAHLSAVDVIVENRCILGSFQLKSCQIDWKL